MKIEKLILGRLMTVNCYIVSTDKACVVIDAGFYDERLKTVLSDTKKERLLLLTHGHFDHIGAVKKLHDETGVKVAIGTFENDALSRPEINLSHKFRLAFEPFSADILLSDGDEITVGDINIKTVFTAGHTSGSVCYLIDNNLFSGDTLFFETCGRTDFPTGNFGDLRRSFDKLMGMLDDDICVYSGHGEDTTIGHERVYNPLSMGKV